jgi:hypothetical protein
VEVPLKMVHSEKPPNQCLEKVLRGRYGEIRRPTEHYKTEAEYGYSLYFKSPVPYAGVGKTWINATFVNAANGPKLTFSDDYQGLALNPGQRATLADKIDATIEEVATACEVHIEAKLGASCETLPAGELCPLPSLKFRVNPPVP